MNAPIPAWLALAWVVIGIPLILYAATRVRRGRVGLHLGLMLAAVFTELSVFASFSFLENPSPRRPALQATLYYQVHVFLAVSTLAGMAWQITSRLVPPLRPLHRRTGPVVVAVWCLALLTGAGNFVYLYVMK